MDHIIGECGIELELYLEKICDNVKICDTMGVS